VSVDLHLTDPRDTLKMIRETLCIAQTAIGESPAHWHDSISARIGRIIAEIDRQRPLGPDGKTRRPPHTHVRMRRRPGAEQEATHG
jgi:hypothetical protein